MLHALATIYGGMQLRAPQDLGVGIAATTRQPSLPGTVVPSLLGRVMKCDWVERPQLLASIVLSCAYLEKGSAPLFSLASQTMQDTQISMSKQVIADIVASFAASHFFDLSLFSWALNQYCREGLDASSIATTLYMLRSLHYASHVFVAEGAHAGFPEQSKHAEMVDTVLFPDCPPSFQQQVRGFFENVGLLLLARSETLEANIIWEAAAPIAYAQLLSRAAPFDILSTGSYNRAVRMGDSPPQNPLKRLPALASGSSEDVSEASELQADNGSSLLDFLLDELSSGHTCEPALVVAKRIAKYASLLQHGKQPEHIASQDELVTQPTVPASVLDALLRCMSEQLVVSTSTLSFASIAETLNTLAEAGICPRVVADALVHAADERFPIPSQMQIDDASTVATFFRSLRNVSIDPSPVLRERLVEYTAFFIELGTPVDSGYTTVERSLGDSTLPVATSILSSLHSNDAVDDKHLRSLLVLAVRQIIHQTNSDRQDFKGDEQQELQQEHRLLQVAAFLKVLLQLKSGESILHDAVWVASVQVLRYLRQLLPHSGSNDVSRSLLNVPLELFHCIGEMPMACLRASHLYLLNGLAEHLATGAHALRPPGLVACFDTFSKIRLWEVLENSCLAEPSGEEVFAALQRSCVQSGFPASRANDSDLGDFAGVSCKARAELPRSALLLLRSLLAQARRISAAEAVRAAFFCASALDAPSLEDGGRAEMVAGLAHLLDRLCWDRQRWSQQDLATIARIAMLLRSEFPELLRGGHFSRRVLLTLEELRSGGGLD
jgi:hypothetical protein